jgi:hypothetical protein
MASRVADSDGRPGPYQGFRRGRLAVDRYMSKALQAEGKFAEVPATGLLLTEASPDVRYYPFTQHQEKSVGADWLWWWIDTTGTSFGLLTQAKVLKRQGAGWQIDFGYRSKRTESTQIDKLIAASRTFDVPAAHVLYCGTPAYRLGLDCGLAHGDGANCSERERAGVSIVLSLVAQQLMPSAGRNVAAEAFHWALPLEDIVDPDRPQPSQRPLATTHPDVAAFMRNPQVGARRVAKTMLDAAHRIRMGQFSAALSDEADTIEDAVFRHLPTDRGHFSVPYLAHVLGGLRHQPPDYVRDLLAGRTPPRWVAESVAGIVVIRDSEPVARDLVLPRYRTDTPTSRQFTLVNSPDEDQHNSVATPRPLAS